MKDRLMRIASEPLTVTVGLGVAGAGCIVAGVALIAGTGGALVAGGAFLLAAASLIAKGMSNDV